MARSIRSFSLCLDVQKRLEDVMHKAGQLNNLLPNRITDAAIEPVPVLDSFGLLPEDYDELYNLLGAPQRDRVRSEAGYKRWVFSHPIEASKVIKESNKVRVAAKRRNQKRVRELTIANERAFRDARRSMSYSHVVEAILTLGLDELDAREKSKFSAQGSASGNASQAQHKLSNGKARKATAA